MTLRFNDVDAGVGVLDVVAALNFYASMSSS